MTTPAKKERLQMAVGTDLKSMDFVMFARASEGLSHGRGIVVSFLAMVVGGGFLFLGLYTMGTSPGAAGRVVLFVCWLLCALIAGTGISATGIMLLDRARSAPPRSTSDALIFGLICFLKAVVVGLAIFVASLVLSLVAAVVYFICKIPGVGPIVLFFAHPFLVVIAGLFGFLASIFAALVAPALWDGDTITQAIAKTVAVLKERAVLSVLYLLVMGIVTAIILAILAAVILPGFLSMTGLATGIIGQKLAGGLSLVNNLPFALMYLTSGESGHMTALMLSTVILILLCVAAALQVQLMGLNLVYLGVSQGVDSAGAERVLKQHLDQAKAKADEAKQRALVAAERARQAAQHARTASPAPTPTAASSCPNCQGAIAPEDVFCEHCGHKLR
jgi:hypothetical protein